MRSPRAIIARLKALLLGDARSQPTGDRRERPPGEAQEVSSPQNKAGKATAESLQQINPSYFGLNEVYKGADPEVDIIAVHGLGGHPFRTWTHPSTGNMWLRDSLPEKIPNSRIMSFGYNAAVVNTKSVIGILEYAENLLADLQSNRTSDEEKSRPILFIGHSLGGLVIKKALILAHMIKRCRPILDATIGVVFLGVPHQGAPNTSFAEVAVNIANAVVSVNKINLHDLDVDSRHLQDLSTHFSSLEGFKIITVFESNKTTIALGRSILIVPRNSAVLDLGAREVVFSIEGADHHTVCKFATTEDKQYMKVWTSIKLLIEESPSKVLPEIGAVKPPRIKHFGTQYALSQYFIGRREYQKQIAQALSSKERQCRVAIYGLPGAGKTQLAISFAEENRSTYDVVFLIKASSTYDILQSYKRIHERLHLEKTVDDDIVDQVKWWFTSDLNSNWLLIFDDADQLEEVKLSNYIPPSNGHVIITTRDHRVKDPDLAKTAIRLDMLSPEESIKLLRSRDDVGDIPEDEISASKEIAELLGHHPLALDQAAAWTHHKSTSFRGYVDAYLADSSEPLDYRPSWSTYDRSITKCLNLSFQALKLSSTQATALFLIFAHLDLEIIPREILQRGVTLQLRVGIDGQPFEQTPDQGCVDHGIIILMSDQFALGKAIESILSLSLVSRTEPGSQNPGFSLHPLIQSNARSQVKGDEKTQVVLEALGLVAQAFPSHFFWERFRNFQASRISEFIDHSRLRFTILSHVRACCANLETMANENVQELITNLTKISHTSDTSRKWTLFEHAITLFLEAYYVEKIPFEGSWSFRFMSLVEKLLQGHEDVHLDVLRLHNKRSLLYKEGQYKEALAASTEFLLTNYPFVLDRGNRQMQSSIDPEPRLNAEVGYVLIKHAELLVTERASQEAFLESGRLLGLCRPVSDNSPSLAERVMLSERDRILAKGYKDLGLWKVAAKFFQDYCTDCLFPGTPQEGWATADWAQVLLEDGMTDEAEKVIEGPLNARLSKHFATFSRVATRGNDTILLQINLAEVRLRQGNYSDAEAKFNDCLNHMSNLDRLEHPEKTRVFSIYCGLARISHLSNDWATTKLRWEKALKYGLASLWDRTHFYIAVVLYSLADVQYELGNLEEGASQRHEVESSGALLMQNRVYWMLGIGTYWFREMEEKMELRK